MRKRAKEGRCEGRKPYGYYKGESVALERLNALRAQGLGFDRIRGANERKACPNPYRKAVTRRSRQ